MMLSTGHFGSVIPMIVNDCLDYDQLFSLPTNYPLERIVLCHKEINRKQKGSSRVRLKIKQCFN